MEEKVMKVLTETLGRIIVPLVTPFTQQGELNYEAAGKLVSHLIEKKYCDSILVAGTTGEFHALSSQERIELFKVVKEAASGRAALVAGTGAGSSREALRLTQEAEKLGYNAVMVVSPYYCRPNQEGIYRHFETIARGTSLPVMLYNIPLFSGVNIDPETVSRLAGIENIKGIKDELGLNPTQMTEYARMTPEDFVIYNGDDIMILCGLVQGAAGTVSGGSHLAGDKIRTMMELFLSGNNREALKIHMALDPFFKALCPNRRVNPIPVLKAALEIAGHPVGPPRLPLDTATEQERAHIREHLIRLAVIQ
jgi:4-hydroxy-tetrahydrodipicolinate synthase